MAAPASPGGRCKSWRGSSAWKAGTISSREIKGRGTSGMMEDEEAAVEVVIEEEEEVSAGGRMSALPQVELASAASPPLPLLERTRQGRLHLSNCR